MSKVTSDIKLEIGHWFPGKSVTAFGRFDYYIGGIVIHRTRYIAAYRGSEDTLIKTKWKRNFLLGNQICIMRLLSVFA